MTALKKVVKPPSYNKELLIVSVIIFITVIYYNMNFLLSYFVVSEEFSFSGIIGLLQVDYNVYFSMIEQVKQGSWLVQNFYSTEMLGGYFFHPLWLVLGKIAQVLHINSVSIFHWAKIYSGVIFLYFLYFLVRQVFTKTVWRLLALIGFGFMAGWGRWLSLIQQGYYQQGEIVRLLFGVDMWHVDGFVFLSLTHSALAIISQILLISSWWLLVYQKKNLVWWSALILFILGLIHPYDILIFWAVAVIWFVLKLFTGKANLIGWLMELWPHFFVSLLLAIYYLIIIFTNTNFGGWFNQNITPPSSFYSLFIGYGWLWLFSIYGLIRLFKKLDNLTNIQYWLIAWFVILPVLMFAPLNFSRRLINSFGAIIIIMSMIGIKNLWQNYFKLNWDRSKHGALLSFLGVFFMITVMITPLYQGIENILVVKNITEPAYLPKDQIALAKVFADVEKTSVILADSILLGNLIPGHSARFVYLGHPHQTVNFLNKYKNVKNFYSQKNNNWQKRQQFIKTTGIDYVVWPQDRIKEVPAGWSVLYQNNSYIVYDVRFLKAENNF